MLLIFLAAWLAACGGGALPVRRSLPGAVTSNGEGETASPCSTRRPFRRLTTAPTDDQTVTLPDAFAGDFAVVLFYRGRVVPVLRWPGDAGLDLRDRAPGVLHLVPIRAGGLSVAASRRAAVRPSSTCRVLVMLIYHTSQHFTT